MLKVNLESLNFFRSHSENDLRALQNSWEGDYVFGDDGRRWRALPFERAIDIVSPFGAVKLADDVEGPLEQVSRLRYYLSNRRLKVGKCSIASILRVDRHHFKKHLALIDAASRMLHTIFRGLPPPGALPSIWDELTAHLEKSPKRYKFEEELPGALKPILLDEPKIGFSVPEPLDLESFLASPVGGRFVGFNEEIFTKCSRLYYSYAFEFIHGVWEAKKHGEGFFAQIMETIESSNKRKWELEKRVLSSRVFSEAIVDDMKSFS